MIEKKKQYEDLKGTVRFGGGFVALSEMVRVPLNSTQPPTTKGGSCESPSIVRPELRVRQPKVKSEVDFRWTI
jgi:hypothetical protein